MRPAGRVVGFGKAALGIGLEEVEQDRQHGVEMWPQRLAVGPILVRELIDVRPCMLFPCLGSGLIYLCPFLLDLVYLTLESVQYTRCLTETISEEFYRRVFQLCFRQTFRQRRL